MEAASFTSHFRSISLPSRLTHPSFTKIETKTNDLKLSLLLSSENIQSGLVGLAELYAFVDEHVQSPQTQQALSRKHNGIFVEDILEASIGLLDLCSTLKELIMLMKENTQTLQSALRRKGDDSIAATEISAYLCFRKKAKKSIIKSLGTLKHLEKKIGSFMFLDADHHVQPYDLLSRFSNQFRTRQLTFSNCQATKVRERLFKEESSIERLM